jgi:hypothetical protein
VARVSIWDGGRADQPEAELEATWHSQPDEWRGNVHLEDWPEHLAGPEYWLAKRELEDS